MKKIFTFLISVSLALLFCISGTTKISAQFDDADSVAISGKGVIYVPADTASISFCVESHAQSKQDAQAENEKSVAALRAALSGYGCIAEDSYYFYEDPCSGSFTVNRCMTLTTEKPDSANDISHRLIDNGATGVNFICYNVKDLKPYAGSALKLAVEDAQSKAAALGMNLKLSGINDTGCFAYYDGKCDKDGRRLVAIECNVSVNFEHVP